MRAMTASGTVPSTIVGRIRCADGRAEGALLVRQQRVDQQEAGDRLDEVLHGDAARDRRPAELHREQQDQEQAPPEDRHRIAGQRHAHDAMIEDRVAPHRRDDAGRQADGEREQDGADATARSSPGTGVRNSDDDRLVGDDRACPRSPCSTSPEIDGRIARGSAGRSRIPCAAARAAPDRCRARRPSSRSDRRGRGGSRKKASSVIPMKVGITQADAGEDEAQHPTTISPPLSLPHKGCSFGTHPLCSGYRQRRGGRWT